MPILRCPLIDLKSTPGKLMGLKLLGIHFSNMHRPQATRMIPGQSYCNINNQLKNNQKL